MLSCLCSCWLLQCASSSSAVLAAASSRKMGFAVCDSVRTALHRLPAWACGAIMHLEMVCFTFLLPLPMPLRKDPG